MKILITGRTGFSGRHLAQELLNRGAEVISLERLKPGTNLVPAGIKVFFHDFRAPLQDELLKDIGTVDAIIHMGAEVMAARSIADPLKFIQSNAVGTFNMLEAARKLKVKRFVYISSSEVFGPSKTGEYHDEDAPLNPSNPYSASKAGGEMLCCAYFKSFAVPTIIVRPVNLFGIDQDPSRFITLATKAILANEKLKLYARGNDISTRQWIFIDDYIDALLFLTQASLAGGIYNIAGNEFDNLELSFKIAKYLGKEFDFELMQAAPTYDLHLRLSDKKLKAMGWTPKVKFEERFKSTIQELHASLS